MGMSTSVVGFIPPDEKWQQMKAVYDSCAAAGVPVPTEVEFFFGGVQPDPHGREIEMADLKACGAVKNWKSEYSEEGYEVELAKLPSNVKFLRFRMSW